MLRVTALWIQRLLLVIGFALLGYVAAEWLSSRIRQAQGNRELDRILTYRPAPGKTAPAPITPAPVPIAPVPDGGLIGRMEIPKLHLSAVVFQGTGNSVLNDGVGHLDGTALPGQPGNVVLAAHRDTFFRSLRNIQKGDVVTVTTESGVRTYKVDWTRIVEPTAVEMADPTPKPALTLITCYPFYYVGHAPKRFIVRAQDIGETGTPTEDARAANPIIPAPGAKPAAVSKALQ